MIERRPSSSVTGAGFTPMDDFLREFMADIAKAERAKGILHYWRFRLSLWFFRLRFRLAGLCWRVQR